MKDNSALKIFEQIKSFCNSDTGLVLEIGCGNGRISSLLLDKATVLIGIDPDGNKIKEAHADIPNGMFLAASGENLSFADDFFDLVVFTLSLHHHQDSEKALKEACRVVKSNGLILVIEPLIEGEITSIFAIAHNENQEKLNAKKAVMNSGLNIIHSEKFEAQWFFENKEDLCKTILDYYDMPFDTAIAQKIYSHLGNKAGNKPLKLADSMIIQVLRLRSKNEKS